jgi:predicted PurR-regulated permease PerM
MSLARDRSQGSRPDVEPAEHAAAAADQDSAAETPSVAPLAVDPAISAVAAFRRRALAVGFGVVALAVVALLVIIYLPLARSILWAVTLAILFYPVHRRFLTAFRGHAHLAALASTLLALFVVVVPAFLIFMQLLQETQNLWPSIRQGLGPDTFLKLARVLEESPLRPAAHWLFGTDPAAGAAAIEKGIEQIVNGFRDLVLGQLTAVSRSAPRVLLGVVITLFTFFFFLRSGPRWIENVKSGLPLDRTHADHLLHIAGQAVGAVFRGVLVTAGIQAVLAGLGYWVAGAPVPILLASLTLITALVPFVGPVAVWLPTAIGLLLAGHRVAGAGLFVWGMCVVSLVDNFLRPYLIGREMKLPILWLFLAIIGGLRVFGFLGLMLGPAALALFLACYRIYTEERSS